MRSGWGLRNIFCETNYDSTIFSTWARLSQRCLHVHPFKPSSRAISAMARVERQSIRMELQGIVLQATAQRFMVPYRMSDRPYMRLVVRFRGTCSITVTWLQAARMRTASARMLAGFGIRRGEIIGRGHKRISVHGTVGTTGCERASRQLWWFLLR